MHRLVSNATARFALAALLLATLLAPGAAFAKPKKKKAIDPTKLQWPAAPEIARIRYVAQYHGLDVQGIRKQGWLERIAGVQDTTNYSSFVKPYGVAVDSKGRAFITDTNLAVVFVLDLEKKELELRGDKPPAALKKPTGVAVDANDRLFIADSEQHNVTVLGPNGEFIKVFGQDTLLHPAGMAIDQPMNRLYVADVKARKVAQFNLTTFEFERWIGKSTEDEVTPEERDKVMVAPTNLAVDPDGLIYVVDSFLNRIHVFDTDGEPVRKIGDLGTGAGKFMRPRGIAIDSDGHIYVTDAMAHTFQILTPDGKGLMPVGGAGLEIGQFRVPGCIAIDKNNRIFVADQGNNRVQVFRYITDAEAAAEAAKRGETTPAKSAGTGSGR